MRKLAHLIQNGDFQICRNQDQRQYFETMIQQLNNRNMVRDGFAEALRHREQQFPTGIETRSLGVAVPHVDSEYVKENALFITAFQPPVDFFRMDKPDRKVSVVLSFLLLIKDVSSHTATLAQLTEVWKDEELLKQLSSATSKEEVIALLSGEKAEEAKPQNQNGRKEV